MLRFLPKNWHIHVVSADHLEGIKVRPAGGEKGATETRSNLRELIKTYVGIVGKNCAIIMCYKSYNNPFWGVH